MSIQTPASENVKLAAKSTGVRWNSSNAYIRMASGEKVYLTRPSADQIRIKDVAFHMARINRYTGASTFTNGQHSVVAARMAKRFYPDAGLLPARMMIHDIAEHVLGDVSSPLKSLLPDYKALEAAWDLAVEERFNLTFLGIADVKEVDDRMWLTERLKIYPKLTKEDDYLGPLDAFDLDSDELAELFEPWPTEVVEHEFLTALREELPWVT